MQSTAWLPFTKHFTIVIRSHSMHGHIYIKMPYHITKWWKRSQCYEGHYYMWSEKTTADSKTYDRYSLAVLVSAHSCQVAWLYLGRGGRNVCEKNRKQIENTFTKKPTSHKTANTFIDIRNDTICWSLQTESDYNFNLMRTWFISFFSHFQHNWQFAFDGISRKTNLISFFISCFVSGTWSLNSSSTQLRLDAYLNFA